MTSPLPGVALGLIAGSGIVLVLLWWQARRPLPLVLRIGPFVGVPGTADASLRRARYVRGRRPRRGPGTGIGVEGTAIGIAAGVVAGAGLVAQGGSAITIGVLAVVGGVTGRWCAAVVVRSRQRQRRRVIQRQLPMLADLLSLGVAAGLTPVAALESAADALRGPVAQEVRVAVADVHAGLSTEIALRGLATRIGLTEFDRFVEAVLLALAMGTPLAEVVRGQASDLRVEERRVLMEVAGRKDALMLVPIVFLVLPSVLVIALYPGLQSLRLVVP